MSLREVFEMIAPRVRPAGADRSSAGAEGRHARHLRGYVAGAGGSRVCAVGRPRRGSARDVRAGWKRFGNDETLLCDRWLLVVAVVGRWRRARPSRSQVPPGTAEADKFLFERGQEEFKERNWLRAREYFRQIVDNYPQSPFRPDAKLAVGDTYIGEDTTESLLLAANEFREFLTFYPDQRARRLRAVPARVRLLASRCSRPTAIRRATRDAIKELQVFLDRYPNSPMMPDARKLMREAKDRLSEASYRVGCNYYRIKWYLGAIDRFREVLEERPRIHPPRRGLLPSGRIAAVG